MAEITAERKLITLEEADYRSGVSEGISFKIGAGLNFNSTYQGWMLEWKINGVAGYLTAPQLAVDGGQIMQWDSYLVGVSLYMKEGGTSGLFEANIKASSTLGSQGSSIFSITPKLSSANGDLQWLHYDHITATTSPLPVNATAPTVTTDTFTKGQLITCDFVQIPAACRDIKVQAFFRPR